MGFWEKIRSWDFVEEWKNTDSTKKKVWIAFRVALMLIFGIALGILVLATWWLILIAVLALGAASGGRRR